MKIIFGESFKVEKIESGVVAAKSTNPNSPMSVFLKGTTGLAVGDIISFSSPSYRTATSPAGQLIVEINNAAVEKTAATACRGLYLYASCVGMRTPHTTEKSVWGDAVYNSPDGESSWYRLVGKPEYAALMQEKKPIRIFGSLDIKASQSTKNGNWYTNETVFLYSVKKSAYNTISHNRDNNTNVTPAASTPPAQPLPDPASNPMMGMEDFDPTAFTNLF